MNFEALFIIKLTALAKICRLDLDENIIKLYDQGLADLGYDRLCSVIDEILFSRDDRDPFPSVKKIRNKIIPQPNEEAEAIEAAARIVQSVSKFGYSNGLDAKKFMGSLAWRVVERFGGWLNVCETMTPDNVGTLQAQFRGIAKAQLTRSMLGLCDEAPNLHQINQKRSGELTQSNYILGSLLSPKPEAP